MYERMYERVYVTGLGGIFGGAVGMENIWKMLTGPETRPETLEAVADHLSFSLAGLHQTLKSPLVRAMPYTDAELAKMAEVKKPRAYDRHQLFAFIAAQEAMQSVIVSDFWKFACVGATGGAGLNEIHETEKVLLAGKRASPGANLRYLPNLFVGHLTQMFNIKGPSHVHGTACAAGAHAIADAVRLIRFGEADVVLVVGTEAAISPYGIATFNSQRALGNGRAFDADRSGFVMGEGAAALVLEAETSAKRRKAKPYAVIAGWGESSDAVAGGQVTDPDANGQAHAARLAIERAKWSPRDVEYINAHGTGTGLGDIAEIEGIRSWGARKDVMVSSSKPAIGHLLGAAGVAEAALCTRMLQQEQILPTWGLQHIDRECDGVHHVREVLKLKRPCTRMLSQSFGFGGTNAVLALERI